jgi:5-methylcytosine-specific restriction endonuclease McrA
MRKSTGEYPANWTEIALAVKAEAGNKCVRCGHADDRESGHVLTVHHLDMNPANCEWWNLAALCQRCHLHIQNKVIMERVWMLPHSSWFKPYAAGFYAAMYGYPTLRVWVEQYMDELIALGQGRMYGCQALVLVE